MPTKEFAKVQKKTFTRWVNERYLSANKHHPKTKEICEVKDFAEFKDGILLCCLMELLTKTKLRYNKKPKWEMMQMENLTVALQAAKRHAVSLLNQDASVVYQNNEKLILGFLWKLILRFQMTDSSGDSEMLAWVNQQIAPYGITCGNFSSAWTDAKVVTGLVASLDKKSSPADYDMNNLGDSVQAANKAIQKALTSFGIPIMIDAEDMVNSPDKHSIMTYVTYFQKNVAANVNEEADDTLPGEKEAKESLIFGEYEITVSARDLIQMDKFTKSDPIVGLYAHYNTNELGPDGSVFTCKTEWLKNSHDPDFATVLYGKKAATGLVFKVYDMTEDGIGEKDLIGSVTFTDFDSVTEDGITFSHQITNHRSEERHTQLLEKKSTLIVNIKRISGGKLAFYNLFNTEDHIWQLYDENDENAVATKEVKPTFDFKKDTLEWKDGDLQKSIVVTDTEKLYSGKVSDVFHTPYAQKAKNTTIVSFVTKLNNEPEVVLTLGAENSGLRNRVVAGAKKLLKNKQYTYTAMVITTTEENSPAAAEPVAVVAEPAAVAAEPAAAAAEPVVVAEPAAVAAVEEAAAPAPEVKKTAAPVAKSVKVGTPGSVVLDAQRNQWFVEHYDGVENKEPIILTPSIKEGVFVGNCKGGIFMVNTKTKSLAISNCTNIGVVCGDVIAQISIVNCKKIQVQTTGTVPIVQIDKSERITFYVSEESLSQEIPIRFQTSAVQGVNVISPPKEGEEDMEENPAPETVSSTFVNGKLVHNVVVPGQE